MNKTKAPSSAAPAPPTLSSTIGIINAFKSMMKKNNNKNNNNNNNNNNKGNASNSNNTNNNNKIPDNSTAPNSVPKEGLAQTALAVASSRERRASSEAPPPLLPSNQNQTRIERSNSDAPIPSITNVFAPSTTSSTTNAALAYMSLSPSSRAAQFKTYKFRPLPPLPPIPPSIREASGEKNGDIMEKQGNNRNNDAENNKENINTSNTKEHHSISSKENTPPTAGNPPLSLPPPLRQSTVTSTGSLAIPLSASDDFDDDFGIIVCDINDAPLSPSPFIPPDIDNNNNDGDDNNNNNNNSNTNTNTNSHKRGLSVNINTLPSAPLPLDLSRQNTPHHLNKIEIPSEMFNNFYSINDGKNISSSISNNDANNNNNNNNNNSNNIPIDLKERKEDVEGKIVVMERSEANKTSAGGDELIKEKGEEGGDGDMDDFILINDYNEIGTKTKSDAI